MKKLWSILFILIFYTNLHAQTINDTLHQQTQLIEDVKNDFISISLSVENLKNENANLIIENDNMKVLLNNANIHINKLEENIISLKSALSSNKEDESVVIQELSNIFNQLEDYKRYIQSVDKKLNDVSLFVNIFIPLTTIPIIALGTYEYINGNDKLGKIAIIGGTTLFMGLEITYQSGRFIFKKW